MQSSVSEDRSEAFYAEQENFRPPVLVAVRPILLDWNPLADTASPGDHLASDTINCLDGDRFSHLENIQNVHRSTSSSNAADGSGDAEQFVKYDRDKQLEVSIIDLVEQSAIASEGSRQEEALSRAKEALEILDELTNQLEQQKSNSLAQRKSPTLPVGSARLTTGVRLFELSLMVKSNLAEQLQRSGHLEKSLSVYGELCKLASGSSSARFSLHRFGLNMGNILHQMKDYQGALKHYRLTLDRMMSTSGYDNFKIKLMNNIAITLLSMSTTTLGGEFEAGQKSSSKEHDGLMTSMKVLFSENLMQHSSESSGSKKELLKINTVLNRNHHRFALNLLTCEYLIADRLAMTDTMRSLARTDLCPGHYKRLDTIDTIMNDAVYDDRVRRSGNLKDGSLRRAQVSASIERDRWERMIRKQHELARRALIVGCQLMSKLDDATAPMMERGQQTSSRHPSGADLLAASELHKHLVADLKMNDAIRALLSGQSGTRIVLDTFSSIEAATKVSSATTRVSSSRSNGPHLGLASRSSLVETNLCFLELMRKNYDRALEHASNALKVDEQNANALVNLANCYFFLNQLEVAQKFYRRALAVAPNSWQASYNSALLTRKLRSGLDGGAELPPDDEDDDVIAHGWLAARCAELRSSSALPARGKTVEGEKLLLPALQAALLSHSGDDSRAPSDSGLASSIAHLSSQDPELQLMAASELATGESGEAAAAAAMKLLQKANAEHPHNLPILERMVALSIRAYDYESALERLVECIKIRPDQSKWYRMAAECCRRAAKYDLAIAIYKITVDLFPHDAGCLRALVKITEELGLRDDDSALYVERLEKLEAARGQF